MKKQNILGWKNKNFNGMPKIIAHRGASFFSIENTLQSFQKAIDQGADMVELDVQMTRDNKLIVLHDAAIDRISEGTGLVKNFTLADIRKIRIFGKEKIPTLDEMFEFLLDQVNIIIDLKPIDSIPYLLKYFRNKNIRDSVLVSSFRRKIVRGIKYFDKRIMAGLICWNAGRRKIEFCKRNRIDFIHPNFLLLNNKKIARIKEARLGLNIWTLNYKREVKKAIKWKADGIITDRPKKVKQILDNFQ